MTFRLFFAVAALVVVTGPVLAQEGSKTLPQPDDKPGAAGKPIKVFILMGQSNMVGMGDIGPEATKGTLKYLTITDKKYPWLVDGDEWTERKDVYYYDARVKKGAPLSPTANNGNSIGPEPGFGYVMGHVLDEPVLVLKSCVGNRSLGWDLLPPGSKTADSPKNQGHHYNRNAETYTEVGLRLGRAMADLLK